MIIKKIFTILCISLISSFLISCAGKNISTVENISKVKNTNVYLTDLIGTNGDLKVTKVTNEEVVNNILTDIKWTESKSADGTIHIYATGKYKDLELAKKYASLTPLFFVAVFTQDYVEWDQLDDQERRETIIATKEAVNTFLKLDGTSEINFKFNAEGDFQENKDDPYIFNSLAFFGCTINLSGIDRVIKLPPLDVF